MEIVLNLVGDGGAGRLSPNSDGEVPESSGIRHEATSDFKPTGVLRKIKDGRSGTASPGGTPCISSTTTPENEQEAGSESMLQKFSLAPDEDGHSRGGGDHNILCASSSGTRSASALLSSCRGAKKEPDVDGKDHGSPIQKKSRRQSVAEGSAPEVADGHCGSRESPPLVLEGGRRSPSYVDDHQEQGPPGDKEGVGIEGEDNQSKEPSARCQRTLLNSTLVKESMMQIEGSWSRPPSPLLPKGTYPRLTSTWGYSSPAAPLCKPKGTTNDKPGFSLEGVPSEFVALWREDLMKLGLIGSDINQPVTAPKSIEELKDRLIGGSHSLSRSGYKSVWNLDGDDLFEFEPVDEDDLDKATAAAAVGQNYFGCKSQDFKQKPIPPELEELWDHLARKYGRYRDPDPKSVLEGSRAEFLSAEKLDAGCLNGRDSPLKENHEAPVTPNN